MSEYESTPSKSAELVGTWMIVSGLLVIGPVGFVVLGILAYAVCISKVGLVVACLLLLATPFAFMLVWIPLLVVAHTQSGHQVRSGVQRLGRTLWKEACREDFLSLW